MTSVPTLATASAAAIRCRGQSSFRAPRRRAQDDRGVPLAERAERSCATSRSSRTSGGPWHWPGPRRVVKFHHGRADPGGRRLRADQLRLPATSRAGSGLRPVVPASCTGWARRPSRASAAATWAAAARLPLRGFARLGAIVDEQDTRIHIKAGRLRGATSTSTRPPTRHENLIMAASLAPGTTVIDNCALEPEVARRHRVPDQDGRADQRRRHRLCHRPGRRRADAVEHTVMATASTPPYSPWRGHGGRRGYAGRGLA